MKFREQLPTGGPPCPPPKAHDGGQERAFRFIPTATPVAADFASNQAKQEPLPLGVDPCRWASCSLYSDMETIKKKRLLKNLQKFAFVAEIKIAAGSGLLLLTGKHIDFWMFETFDPIAAIVQTQAL